MIRLGPSSNLAMCRCWRWLFPLYTTDTSLLGAVRFRFVGFGAEVRTSTDHRVTAKRFCSMPEEHQPWNKGRRKQEMHIDTAVLLLPSGKPFHKHIPRTCSAANGILGQKTDCRCDTGTAIRCRSCTKRTDGRLLHLAVLGNRAGQAKVQSDVKLTIDATAKAHGEPIAMLPADRTSVMVQFKDEYGTPCYR